MENIRHSTDSLVQENFRPATKNQCWALKLATGIDYREQNLSFQVASDMLKEANEKSGYSSNKPVYEKTTNIPTILHFLASNESIETLKKAICNEMEIKSIISNIDINNKEIEGTKKYVFLGNGCGFSFIKWDKRNSRATRTIEKAKEVSKDIDNLVRQSFDKQVLEYLENCGNSIGAIQAQNMNYKNTYDQLIVNYLQKYYKIEYIYIETRLD